VGIPTGDTRKPNDLRRLGGRIEAKQDINSTRHRTPNEDFDALGEGWAYRKPSGGNLPDEETSIGIGKEQENPQQPPKKREEIGKRWRWR